MFDQLMAAGLGAGLFVDVWNCRAQLAATDGSATVRYLPESAYSPALYEELLDVIDAHGGAINASGRYYVTSGMMGSGIYPQIAAAVLANVFQVPPDYQQPELNYDQLRAIARTWPWNVHDALCRYVAQAMHDAGIEDGRQGLAVMDAMSRLSDDH